MLLAETTTMIHDVVPIYSLDGMTLLIGAFFFYSLARPATIKHRSQFWAVFVCLLSIILLYALRLMLYNSPAGQVFTGVMIGLLQAGGLVLTVMYVGGLRTDDIADALRDTADDFRGGPPAKTPIVPLKGEQPIPARTPVDRTSPSADPPRVVIDLPRSPPERIPVE